MQVADDGKQANGYQQKQQRGNEAINTTMSANNAENVKIALRRFRLAVFVNQFLNVAQLAVNHNLAAIQRTHPLFTLKSANQVAISFHCPYSSFDSQAL